MGVSQWYWVLWRMILNNIAWFLECLILIKTWLLVILSFMTEQFSHITPPNLIFWKWLSNTSFNVRQYLANLVYFSWLSWNLTLLGIISTREIISFSSTVSFGDGFLKTGLTSQGIQYIHSKVKRQIFWY